MRANVIRDFLAQRADTARLSLKQKMGVLLSSSFLILIASFCNRGTLIAVSPPSASALAVSIKIQHQYTTTEDVVMINLLFSQDDLQGPLSSKMGFACNGVELASVGTYLSSNMSVPRQPAGGAYDCVYTDGKGAKTSLTIPIPPGTLTIISPTAGATIHPSDNVTVPTPPGITPTPTPSGSPTPPPLTAALALVSGFEVRYTLPTLPASATSQVLVNAFYAAADGQINGEVVGSLEPANGSYILTDADSPPGTGFDSFPTGASGKIDLHSTFFWTQPPGGFKSVRVEFDDTLSVPVIWSRG